MLILFAFRIAVCSNVPFLRNWVRLGKCVIREWWGSDTEACCRYKVSLLHALPVHRVFVVCAGYYCRLRAGLVISCKHTSGLDV